MNRLERLFRIHRLLQQRRPVPMAKFQASLGVSRTTITRDFEYLRDFMNAPIIYDREANGHHYDPCAPAFELPGFWLNQSELYALLAMEQLLEDVEPGLLRLPRTRGDRPAARDERGTAVRGKPDRQDLGRHTRQGAEQRQREGRPGEGSEEAGNSGTLQAEGEPRPRERQESGPLRRCPVGGNRTGHLITIHLHRGGS